MLLPTNGPNAAEPLASEVNVKIPAPVFDKFELFKLRTDVEPNVKLPVLAKLELLVKFIVDEALVLKVPALVTVTPLKFKLEEAAIEDTLLLAKVKVPPVMVGLLPVTVVKPFEFNLSVLPAAIVNCELGVVAANVIPPNSVFAVIDGAKTYVCAPPIIKLMVEPVKAGEEAGLPPPSNP